MIIYCYGLKLNDYFGLKSNASSNGIFFDFGSI
jgi:hypothetical protein